MNKGSIILALSCLILISMISTRQIRVLQKECSSVANKKWGAGSEMNSGYAGHRNAGMGNGYNGKYDNNNVETGSYNSKKSHNGGNTGNDDNTGKYYTNKQDHKNNGNTVTTGNPTNATTGRKNITGPWPRYGKKEETVFVDISATLFYEYTVTNLNCQIQIKILDQNLKCWQFTFKKDNTIVLIDATNHIILVQEVNSIGAILSLWVIQIVYDAKACSFSIKFFAVNSVVNDEFYYYSLPWYIGEILEYNPIENWIAVTKITNKDVKVYKINVQDEINVLILVNWFYIKRGEQIDGGNSRVLYDKKNDELLIDQKNCRVDSTDPTIYAIVPICQLVKLPLYPCQGTTVNYVSWYFQYLNKSPCGTQLTTFLYQGYGDLPIINPAHLKSTCPIIYKYDDYSFFAAITDCDIYLTTIWLNEATGLYEIFSGLLSNTCFNAKKKAEIVRDWSKAIEIVFIEGTFYLLTKNKFIVYTDCPAQWNKVYENDCIYSNGDATVTLFRQIKLYLKRK